MNTDEKTLELEMTALIKALVKRGWMVVLGAVLGALGALAATIIFVGTQYQTDVVFRVSNQTRADEIITWEDVSASRDLAESCAVLACTRTCLERTAELTWEDRDWEQLSKLVEAGAVGDTEFVQVTVTWENPEEAANIANAIGRVLPALADEVMAGADVLLVDTAVVPEKPWGPDYGRSAAIGLLLGLLVSCGTAVILEIKQK